MELREKVDAAVEEKRQQLAEQRQLLAETKEQAAELRRSTKSWRSVRCGQEDICCVHFQASVQTPQGNSGTDPGKDQNRGRH